MSTLAGVILAAGEGKRMNSTSVNKVSLPLNNKPMIVYGVELLQKLAVSPIIIVVGFAKESVQKVLEGFAVEFAVQQRQLGTADALKTGLQKIPQETNNVLVIQGDDCALYTQDLIQNLIAKHQNSGASVTFLTIELSNPHGLGRVIRGTNGSVVAIVEEKDATAEQKKITEVNPACYIFNKTFLEKYLPNVSKSAVTGEYYLTSLIDKALQSHEKIETVNGGNIPWRGVNTPEELSQAEQLAKGA